MTGQRILGLDVGDRTVGVAASDLLLMAAQGVETIRRETLEKDLARLGELMREYDAVRLVVGLPRNMNGTEGDRCEIVRAFAEEIKKALPEADIVFWDERLSTVAAAKSLAAVISGSPSPRNSRSISGSTSSMCPSRVKLQVFTS